jgi:hypothetical protein
MSDGPVATSMYGSIRQSERVCYTPVGTFKGVVAPILHLLGCSRHSISNK